VVQRACKAEFRVSFKQYWPALTGHLQDVVFPARAAWLSVPTLNQWLPSSFAPDRTFSWAGVAWTVFGIDAAVPPNEAKPPNAQPNPGRACRGP
jgi:hypothetical protein